MKEEKKDEKKNLKVDFNKILTLNNIIAVVIIIVGIVLISSQPNEHERVPDDYISSPEEYVGGDAYNYIVESSLLGGKISGATSSNAIYELQDTIYYCAGFIVIAIGLSKIKIHD